jgi:hypothetical protein
VLAARAAVPVLLAAVSLLAVVQSQSPDGTPLYRPIEASQCWSCHGPDVWVPDMDPVLVAVPEAQALTVGSRQDLPLRVVNSWMVPSKEFELTGFVASLDVSQAPSLRFASDQEAVHVGPLEGHIPFDPVGQASDPASLPELPGYLTRAHSGHLVLQVPEGATEVLFTVHPLPTEGGAFPDVRVALHPGTTQPSDDPVREADGAGPGEAESVHLEGAAVFALYGYGDWTVEVQAFVMDPESTWLLPTTGDLRFTVEMTAWFDTSGSTLAVATQEGGIRSGDELRLSWPVAVVQQPLPGEVLRGFVNVTGHYAIPFEVALDFETGQASWGSPSAVVALEEPPLLALAEVSEAVGYATAFLIGISVWSGGVFGQASRRHLNAIFGSARRRVAFHNALSYGILAFAVVHTVLFLVEVNYHWLLGVLWGGGSLLALFMLGVTGAFQVPLIRRWSHAAWKWTHLGLALACILFAVVHILLDGTNFGGVQEAVGWQDPLVPHDRR